MGSRRTVGLGWLVGLAFSAQAALAADSLAELAARFAPVIRQDTASDQDFLSAFDYDGNWAGDDNWKNQSKFPLRAVVYWGAVETSTHAFVTYGFYHPRDVAPLLEVWGTRLGRFAHLTDHDPEHENDLEGMLLVIEKGPRGPRPVAAETIFHRHFKKYSADTRYQAKDGFEIDGNLPFESEHPVVHVQSRGHGVTAWNGEEFDGDDGVVYRVGTEAGVPSSQDDPDVSYALVELESTLWARRFDVGTKGNTFGTAYEYDGVKIGSKFLGRHGEDDAANAPWSWTDQGTNLPRGTLFLDPARLVAEHFTVPAGFGRGYAPNPFTGRGIVTGPIAGDAGVALETPAGDGLLGQTE